MLLVSADSSKWNCISFFPFPSPCILDRLPHAPLPPPSSPPRSHRSQPSQPPPRLPQKVCLDKITGKPCIWISSNGLAITGIDDRRYWTRIPTEESRVTVSKDLEDNWRWKQNGKGEYIVRELYEIIHRKRLIPGEEDGV